MLLHVRKLFQKQDSYLFIAKYKHGNLEFFSVPEWNFFLKIASLFGFHEKANTKKNIQHSSLRSHDKHMEN